MDFSMMDGGDEPVSKRARNPVDADKYVGRERQKATMARAGVEQPDPVEREDDPSKMQHILYDPEQENRLTGITDPDGTVTLHHYSSSFNGNPSKVIIDPNRLGQNPWSKAEKKASQYPRAFFYTNPADREAMLEGAPHYVTKMPASKIYDMTADPKKIVSRIASRGIFNINHTLNVLKRIGYHGVFYSGSFPTVAMLKPVRAHRVHDEERQKLSLEEAHHIFRDVKPVPIQFLINGVSFVRNKARMLDAPTWTITHHESGKSMTVPHDKFTQIVRGLPEQHRIKVREALARFKPTKLARDHAFHFTLGEEGDRPQKFKPDMGVLFHDAVDDYGSQKQQEQGSGTVAHTQATNASHLAHALGNQLTSGNVFLRDAYDHEGRAIEQRKNAERIGKTLGELGLERRQEEQTTAGYPMSQEDQQTLSKYLALKQAHEDAADAHDTAHQVFTHRADHPELWNANDAQWATRRANNLAHAAHGIYAAPREPMIQPNDHRANAVNHAIQAKYYANAQTNRNQHGEIVSNRPHQMRLTPEHLARLKEVEEAHLHAGRVHKLLHDQKTSEPTKLARSGYGYCFECKAPFIKHDKSKQLVYCPNGHKRRYLGKPPKLKFAMRAPAGGAVINNQFHQGGQILPRAFQRISRVVKAHVAKQGRARVKLARARKLPPHEGWVTPEGEFHPLKPRERHSDAANRLIAPLSPEHRYADSNTAHDMGWMHVAALPDFDMNNPERVSLHGYHPERSFTGMQITRLKQLANMIGARTATVDGAKDGRSSSTTLKLARPGQAHKVTVGDSDADALISGLQDGKQGAHQLLADRLDDMSHPLADVVRAGPMKEPGEPGYEASYPLGSSPLVGQHDVTLSPNSEMTIHAGNKVMGNGPGFRVWWRIAKKKVGFGSFLHHRFAKNYTPEEFAQFVHHWPSNDPRVRQFLERVRDNPYQHSRLARKDNPEFLEHPVLSPEDKAVGSTTQKSSAKFHDQLDASIHNRPGVLPTVDEIKALARTGESVKGQYEHAGRVMSSFIGHDNAKLFTAANAILSPLAKWEHHSRAALRLVRLWREAGSPSDPGAIHSIVERLNPALGNKGERTESGEKIYPSIGWGSKSTKLRELLSDPQGFIDRIERVAASRRGKIVDFGRAFYDPNGVPVDTHMAKAITPDIKTVQNELAGAKGDKDSRGAMRELVMDTKNSHKLAQRIARLDGGDTSRSLQKALLDAQKKVVSSDPTYKAYKVAIAHAAQQLGWEPRQVQECAWSAVVAIVAAKNANVPHDALLQFLRHENAFQAWNVGGLLSTPEITRDIAGLSKGPVEDFVNAANRAPARSGSIDPGDAAAFANVAGRIPANRANGAWNAVEASLREDKRPPF